MYLPVKIDYARRLYICTYNGSKMAAVQTSEVGVILFPLK